MKYRHVQWSVVFLVMFEAAALAVVVVAFLAEAAAGWFALGAFLLIGGILAWFSRLDVIVTPGQVAATFGRGWPRRAIDLTTVTAVRRVRNRWYHGWGIRKVPKGWMFNVWGFDAVELELSSGKVFRIGTDEPDELMGALTRQVH